MKLASVLVIALTIASMGYKAVSRINPASKSAVSSDLSRDNCVEEEFNYTSAKECHCYLFQSAGLSHGSFKSPGFPRYYPINIGCILYIFIGNVDELVELTLYEFDLRPRSKDGKCHDYLRLFLNLDRPELNEKDRFDFNNCDELATISQSVYYSRHRVIIAEFHSSGEVSYNYKYRGFKGNFKFLRRAQFKMDGDRLDDHPCRFRFDAQSYSNGRFFSPGYPQNYPNNTNCVYQFIADDTQRIIVDFSVVSLFSANPKGRCDPVSSGDRLVVYDGLSRTDRVLARYCGSKKVMQVVSHGSQLSVRLSADSDGQQAQGFAGRYQFVNRHTVQPTRLLDDTMRGDGQVSPGSACSHQFQSTEERKSGLFELPERPYQPKFTCVFTFRGRPGERVVINFLSVQLDDANSQWCRSHVGDRIEIYDGMSDAQKWLEVICGKVANKRVISTGASLTVKFEADDVTSSAERGFEARYSFIDDEELRKEMSTPAKEGIATGPSTAAVEGSCRHQIFSQPGEKSGILQSPGYPNGYKKDFVCYWLFYGMSNERIRIKILDFSLNKQQDASVNTELASQASCAAKDRIEIYTFYYQAAIGQVQRSEAAVELCGDSDPTFVMSGQRARLDLFFRSLHGSAGGSARGVRFRYMFVTDFGVRAVGAMQKANKCAFHFSGRHTSNGSFTSPNYPGNYPEDLVCDFVFKGRAQQRISVSFADFDLASSDDSPGCTKSPGDFVEALSCYIPGYRLVRPKYAGHRRLCRRPKKGSFYRIDWPSSCLHLRFHSNSEYTKRGFFAYYSFYYDSDYVAGTRPNRANSSACCDCLVVMAALLLLCRRCLPSR